MAREFKVTVIDETYTENTDDRYHAASQGVRRYIQTHPEHTFTSLMQIVSACLTKPERPGRKARNE